MNKEHPVIETQGVGDETTGFTATLKPEVTNGRNEVDQKRPPILTVKDNACGHMEGQEDYFDKQEVGTESQPGKLYPLSPNSEGHTESFGDPQ